MTDPHTVSPMCEAFIKNYEKLRLGAYMPTAKDVPTIGWGCTRYQNGSPVRMGERINLAAADALFDWTLAQTAARVAAMLPHGSTNQAQFDALVSLAFNIGVRAFHGSTLLHHHIERAYAATTRDFASWRFQAGKVLAGLVKRRAAEARMYSGAE